MPDVLPCTQYALLLICELFVIVYVRACERACVRTCVFSYLYYHTQQQRRHASWERRHPESKRRVPTQRIERLQSTKNVYITRRFSSTVGCTVEGNSLNVWRTKVHSHRNLFALPTVYSDVLSLCKSLTLKFHP